mmetsp:Transcript_21111/g.64299  ORF Transcript_21111/g.64299 Transcript_21111/m.64299 type:complete len:159 (-) Transcript_21111:92-568(-)
MLGEAKLPADASEAACEDSPITPLMSAFYTRLKYKDVTATQWHLTADNLLSRNVSYTMPRSFLVPENRVDEVHVVEADSDGLFCLSATVHTPEVPYGSKFHSRFQLIFRGSADPANNADMDVTADIHYKNGGPPFLLKGQIRSGTEKETARCAESTPR